MMPMKPGHGESFASLDDGEVSPIVSVTKLEDGYTALTIADPRENRAIRAVVESDIAAAIGAALIRASKD